MPLGFRSTLIWALPRLPTQGSRDTPCPWRGRAASDARNATLQVIARFSGPHSCREASAFPSLPACRGTAFKGRRSAPFLGG